MRASTKLHHKIHLNSNLAKRREANSLHLAVALSSASLIVVCGYAVVSAAFTHPSATAVSFSPIVLPSALDTSSSIGSNSAALAVKAIGPRPDLANFALDIEDDNDDPDDDFVLCDTEGEVGYTINFDLGGGNGGPSPNPQTGRTSSGSVSLANGEPTLEEYKFLGWCSVQPIDNKTSSPTCSGALYQPENTFLLCDGVNDPTLYAMWEESGKYMQNWNGCSDLVRYDQGGTVVELVDSRDNNTYKVAKLKDGKCWMVENLRLGDDKISNRTLDSSKSDIDSGTYTLPISSMSNFTGYNNDALYIDPGTVSGHERFGGYYSWYTATAGTGTRSLTFGQNAKNSLCPKGWRLPTGNNGDLEQLPANYGGNGSTGSTNLQALPVPGFVRAGVISGNSWILSSYAFVHTSTAYSEDAQFNLDMDNVDVIYSVSDDNKYYGSNIRCIKR